MTPKDNLATAEIILTLQVEATCFHNKSTASYFFQKDLLWTLDSVLTQNIHENSS